MEIVFTSQAEKDFERIKRSPILLKKIIALLDLIEINPFANPPRDEKLIGFQHVYSRRINIQYRLVYELIEDKKLIKVIRMWTHYE